MVTYLLYGYISIKVLMVSGKEFISWKTKNIRISLTQRIKSELHTSSLYKLFENVLTIADNFQKYHVNCMPVNWEKG